MQEFDDSELYLISEEIDLFITESCIKYKISPLKFSAVTLARLIHLNDSVKSSDDLAKLLLSVGESILNKELEKPDRLH
jgi:hypothetical protein